MRDGRFLSLLVALVFLAGCETGRGVVDSPGLTFGPASTDITATSALVWLRADGNRRIGVEYALNPDFSNSRMTPVVTARDSSDFTTLHRLSPLLPDREYFYRGVVAGDATKGTVGRFRTAPTRPKPFSFAVSGDMSASFQPFTLFDRIAAKSPDFFVHLGDTIYADVASIDFTSPSKYGCTST